MVLAVVEVGRDRLEGAPEARDRQVAAEDVQRRAGLHVAAVEEPDQRRGGHHGLEAGQRLGPRPRLQHRGQEVGHGDVGGIGREPGDPPGHVDQHRHVAIEPAVGERRAGGRAGHPHEAPDAVALLLEQPAEDLQRPAILQPARRAVGAGVPIAVEQVEVGVVERRAPGPHAAAQELTDQPAARMRDEMDLAAAGHDGGELLHQRPGVGDRALGEAAVFERQDAALIGLEEGVDPRPGVVDPERAVGADGFPQPAEAAVGGRGGAVEEDEHRPGAGDARRGRERRRAGRHALQELTAGVAALLDLPLDEAGDTLRDLQLEGRHRLDRHRPPGAPAAGPQRQHRRQQGIAAVAGAGGAEIGGNPIGRRPQTDAVGELQLDELAVERLGRDAGGPAGFDADPSRAGHPVDAPGEDRLRPSRVGDPWYSDPGHVSAPLSRTIRADRSDRSNVPARPFARIGPLRTGRSRAGRPRPDLA